MVGVEHKTVMRILLRVGDHCARLLNERMRRLPCKVVQMDEIWTFVGKKEKRVRFDENLEVVGDRFCGNGLGDETHSLIPESANAMRPIPGTSFKTYKRGSQTASS